MRSDTVELASLDISSEIRAHRRGRAPLRGLTTRIVVIERGPGPSATHARIRDAEDYAIWKVVGELKTFSHVVEQDAHILGHPGIGSPQRSAVPVYHSVLV